MKPKILLADDHMTIRKGIRVLCELNLGIDEVCEVSNCNELMRELSKKTYTHLVLDINLSDGSSIEILPNIRSLYPRLQIAILSMQPIALYAKALNQLGISLFISKSAHEEETVMMLRRFLQNERPAKIQFEATNTNPFFDFTKRELEILHYVLRNVRTNEIANNLNLKYNTISTVKSRIFKKTATTNTKELMELAALHKVN